MKKHNFIEVLLFLKKYLKHNFFKFFSFYLGWLIQSLIIVFTPIIFGEMIDEIIYYNNFEEFISIGKIFVVITIWGSGLYYFLYEIYAHIMVTFTSEIKVDIFSQIMSSDAQYLNKEKAGKLMLFVQEYSDECMNFIVRNLIHNANGILMIIMTLCYIIKISWQIGFVLILVIPFNTMISMYYGKQVRKYGKNKQRNNEEFGSWILEMLVGIRDLRLLGSQKYITSQFVHKQKKIYRENNNTIVKSKIAIKVVEGINLIIRMSVFGVMSIWAKKQEMTIGNIIIILSFVAILIKETKAVCTKYMDGQKRISNIYALIDFFHYPQENIFFGTKDLCIEGGEIEFQNISFSYHKNKEVLKNINLKINSGEKVAIVGESGCGKTTLAYLLDGFYIPKKGTVSIDGQNISNYSLRSLRNSIGYVQQNVMIFNGTIKENILMGNINATEEALKSACEHSGLMSLIERLPYGWDTLIGAEGMSLSGGEKQRIAIARIYIKNPPILIFDEATSALDMETENEIHKCWEKLLSGRTAIIIAHRLQSVMLCDKVALVSDGVVDYIGKSDEILNNKKFTKLFALE